MKQNIVLIGAPGCGKGTQCDILKTKLNLLKVSPGDILREYKKDNTRPLFGIVNELLNSGKLLPDEIINQITEEFVINNATQYNGILFDGYPRSVGQAEYLDTILNKNGEKLNIAIMFDIRLDNLINRIRNRYMCAECGAIYNHISRKTAIDGVCDECGAKEFITRVDDGEESIIRTRFDEFSTKTMPVITFYQKYGKLKIIDSDKAVDLVHNDIINIINGSNY